MKIENSSPARLVVVSNRGPYYLRMTKQGLKREKTVGGLVTSILPMLEKRGGGVWIAWGERAGRYPGAAGPSPFDLRYISLTEEQLQGYYLGVANNALWPLCHSFLGRVHYDDTEWETYRQVNAQFAEAVLEEAHDGEIVWVHDYHLALVPHLVRQARPESRLLFFWHIPFPPVELFRTLPWRREILEGLLASDIVGFHIPEYADNFVEAAVEILGAEARGDQLVYDGRNTQVLARPIGIDYEAVSRTSRARVIEERARRIRQNLNGQQIILGVERMDYTKGIFERLEAMERLLERRPELYGRVTLIQIVTPSRNNIEAYRQKKRETDEIVGRINGRFSDGFWMPIRYLYRSFTPAELMAYYRAADIALVTPLRDGLNLVAKEYIACRPEADGVLILSEFAGVSQQLPEALLVNPYDRQDMVEALGRALAMEKPEQRERMLLMQKRIKEQDISWWADEFLSRVDDLAAAKPIHRYSLGERDMKPVQPMPLVGIG
ncbi:MAG: trehalose-6-phosphate synthase [Chloroflexi bacterium]|nr:trehalose-6-phosphate synthase [Chloroflexota bacterium]MCL5952372.1 trehalose-6-phosphate synthase [Chloroflexota bacterium]